MSHTSTPWEIRENVDYGIQAGKEGLDYFITAPGISSQEIQANAAFIVLAVNAHEKLLEAVKMVFEAADDGGGMTDIDWDMLRDAYNLGLKGEA